jgi:GntR family transcriptional regulator/MocR family aminotransferase
MPDECTSSAGRDLFLALDRARIARAGGLRAGIEDALREAIGHGRLAVGAALPSTRTLAADLGVAGGPCSPRTSSSPPRGTWSAGRARRSGSRTRR